MQILGIIPARYASSRFPGKPLVLIQGKSMIQRVYEQVEKSELVTRVIVATDDQRIFDHVESFGGQAMMTGDHHRSGTDRCAEVAARFPAYELVINIQGDEPFIQPSQIDLAVSPLLKNKDCQIATLARKIQDAGSLQNPNIVKVVFSQSNKALYFSRNPVPYIRDQPKEDWINSGRHFKHIGLYAFRRDILEQISQLASTPLEQLEGLEQLRWLENGFTIDVSLTDQETIGIDTPEDLEQVR